jgi:type I restriction enzyme, S subunit
MSAAVRAGYKLTEVGAIPAEWDCPLLDTITKRGSGHTPDKTHPEYWGGNIKWISLKDSSVLDQLFIDETAACVTPTGIANSSAVVHPAGTVVLSRDAGVGKSAIMKCDMAVSQHFIAWQCGSKLDNVFLYYWLQARKPEFERIAMGSTIKTIGLPYFRMLKILSPPLIEQRAIAAALSDVDALLAKHGQLIAKKQGLKQAAMQQLLTGQTRLPGFSGDWVMKRVEDFGEVVTGGTPRTEVKDYWGEGYPWITPTDISSTRDMFASERSITTKGLNAIRALPKNTLLVTCIASIGKNAILKTEGSCNQQVNAIVPNSDSCVEFLYYLLESSKQYLFANAGTTATSMISKATFSKLTFLTPLFKEQSTIAAILSDMDTEIAALEERQTKTRALKQGMMQELLTGRTRLV